MGRKQTIDDVLPTMTIANTLRGVANSFGLKNVTECRAVVVALVDPSGNVQVVNVGLDELGQAMLLSQSMERTLMQIASKNATTMTKGRGPLSVPN